MGGLLFASFLAHFFGFIGPFAAMGLIFLVYTIFLNQMIEFLPPGATMFGSGSTHNENSV
jgi:hypothetical protein